MKIRNSLLVVFGGLTLIMWGCFQEIKESPTKGYLKCYSDESLNNVAQDAKIQFLQLYPNSKIDLMTMKAREGIAAILNGEIKMFISSRNFNKEEIEFYNKSKSEVKSFKFCYDGVALFENENGKINQISTDELKQVLLGNAKNIKVFIPEPNSGVYEYLRSELLENKTPLKAFICKSENDVVDKIKHTNNSIGIVGLNVLKNITGIKVIEVGASGRTINGIQYYEPLPGYLVNGNYPLVRTAYIMLNEVGLHVASGFATYLTSYDGQKIVLQNQLGPATVPVKLVQ